MKIDDFVVVSQDIPEDEMIVDVLEEPMIENLEETLDIVEETSSLPTITPVDIPDVIVSTASASDTSFSIPVGSYVAAGKVDGLSAGGGGGGTGIGQGVMQKFRMKNFFGSDTPVTGALVGNFYDLKQSSKKKLLQDEMRLKQNPGDTKLAKKVNDAYKERVLQFLKSWNPSALSNFYKASRPLNSPLIFIPSMQAEEAPKAFKVEKEVEPSRWCVHYKGNFVAPATGNFRFVGLADDMMIVRFKKENILDASIGYYVRYGIKQTTIGKFFNQKFHASDWLSLHKGETYPIEILLGERPGQIFYAFLMIQQQGVKYGKGSHGLPALPIFRTLDTRLPNFDPSKAPKIDEKGPVFGNQ